MTTHTRRQIRPPHRARCTCGLRLVHHFTPKGRMLSCEQAADAHRWAGIRFRPLRELMLAMLEEGR
jgi:hypothetical protein